MIEFDFGNDITTLCIIAESFPDGISDAYQKLNTLVPVNPERRCFGYSRPENGKIVYRAMAEQLQSDQGEQYGCEIFTIPAGRYTGKKVENYHENLTDIMNNFQELTTLQNIDPVGFCLEWYLNEKDMYCLIKLV
ncbi:MAG: transcriptional regulator [Ignavibacteria bacterium]|nr:transcriptional regulator [Ignavibacteria bacterium]